MRGSTNRLKLAGEEIERICSSLSPAINQNGVSMNVFATFSVTKHFKSVEAALAFFQNENVGDRSNYQSAFDEVFAAIRKQQKKDEYPAHIYVLSDMGFQDNSGKTKCFRMISEMPNNTTLELIQIEEDKYSELFLNTLSSDYQKSLNPNKEVKKKNHLFKRLKQKKLKLQNLVIDRNQKIPFKIIFSRFPR